MLRRLLRWFLVSAGLGLTIFLLAGRWTDPWLWTYVGSWSAILLVAVLGTDDDLARERRRPGGPSEDRLPLVAIRVLAIAHIVAGALDAGRWHLMPVPPWLRGVGLAAMLPSLLLVVYALQSNRFFSAAVRIQAERGHRVVDRGPYAVIRHPGYAGMIPSMPLSALALGSWIAFGLAAAYSLLILRRVVFEDAFLKAKLSGYAEYSRRVPYRLVPGVW